MATLTIDSNDSNGLRVTAATSWASAVAGSSGAFGLTSFTIDVYRTNSSNFELSRAFTFFDLSGIPAGSTINSATLRIPAVANYDNDWNGTLYIVSHTQDVGFAANSTNFAKIGNETTYGSKANSTISTSVDNDITIEQAGIDALLTPNIGGSAKIGLRHRDDIDGGAGSTTDNTGDTANIAATTWDLIIDYTAPVATGGFYYMSV